MVSQRDSGQALDGWSGYRSSDSAQGPTPAKAGDRSGCSRVATSSRNRSKQRQSLAGQVAHDGTRWRDGVVKYRAIPMLSAPDNTRQALDGFPTTERGQVAHNPGSAPLPALKVACWRLMLVKYYLGYRSTSLIWEKDWRYGTDLAHLGTTPLPVNRTMIPAALTANDDPGSYVLMALQATDDCILIRASTRSGFS